MVWMPRVALSVGPISGSRQYRHAFKGHFTWSGHLQAPITAGEWLAERSTLLSRSSHPSRSPQKHHSQQQAARITRCWITPNHRHRGWTAPGRLHHAIVGKASRWMPFCRAVTHWSSSYRGYIVGLNGSPVQTTDDLINAIKAQSSLAPVHLLVKRLGRRSAWTSLVASGHSADTPSWASRSNRRFDYTRLSRSRSRPIRSAAALGWIDLT